MDVVSAFHHRTASAITPTSIGAHDGVRWLHLTSDAYPDGSTEAGQYDPAENPTLITSTHTGRSTAYTLDAALRRVR